MKKILYVVGVLLSMSNGFAQNTNNIVSIRTAVKDHLVAIGELSPNIDVANSLLLTVYDVLHEVDVTDISMQIPSGETLSYYRILVLGPHTYTHLMFARNDKWMIINMRKSLLDIMTQSIELCRLLALDTENSLYVFKEILQYYESNIKNTGGVSIDNS